MIFLLYFITIFSSVLTGLFYKAGSTHLGKHPSAPALMCGMYMSFAAVGFAALILLGGGSLRASLSTVLCGMFCGASLTCAAYFYLRSLTCGPYTTSIVLLNFSSFMSIIYSVVFLHEEMSLIQAVGFVVMLICIYILTVSKETKDTGKKANLKWMAFILCTFFTNGFINFALRLQIKLNDSQYMPQMRFYYFLFAAITSIIIFTVTGGFKKLSFRKDYDKNAEKDSNEIFLFAFIPAALGLASSLSVNTYASSELVKYVSAAVQYPVCSGTSLIVSTFIGRIFFKEKLKPLAYAAIAVGIAVIAVLNIF